MSDTATRQRPAMKQDAGDPFGVRFEGGGEMTTLPMQPVGGSVADTAMARIITAQRVAIKRDKGGVLAAGLALAHANGSGYYYRFPVKNKQKGTTEYIEGPSIGCAMGAVSVYGNCLVEAFPAQETQTHWVFLGRFVDYETGVTVTRSFQQRKSQRGIGGADAGRQEDIIFQIGQSKCIRNVICAAIPWLTDEMEKAAKKGTLDRIQNNPEGVRKWLADRFAEAEIDIIRVERVVGRKLEKWSAPDMAKLLTNLQSLKDGFADAEELFPTDAQTAQENADAADGQQDMRGQGENAGGKDDGAAAKADADRAAAAKVQAEKAEAEKAAAEKAAADKLAAEKKAAKAAAKAPTKQEAPKSEPEPAREEPPPATQERAEDPPAAEEEQGEEPQQQEQTDQDEDGADGEGLTFS